MIGGCWPAAAPFRLVSGVPGIDPEALRSSALAMPPSGAAVKKGLIIKASILLVGLLIVGGLMWRGVHPAALAREAAALTGRIGPWPFFAAVAVLPAFGMPLSPFALLVGPTFEARLGLWGVLSAYGFAVAVNLAFTYWLARFAVRPWAHRLVARYGYTIPRFSAEEELEVVFITRVTFGPPFFLQSYLLGLADVSFRTYLWVSWLIAMIYAVGLVAFGASLSHGKGGLAFIGVSLLLAAATVTHLIRKRLKKSSGPKG